MVGQSESGSPGGGTVGGGRLKRRWFDIVRADLRGGGGRDYWRRKYANQVAQR